MPSFQSLPLQALHIAFGGVIVEREGRPRVVSYGDPGGEYAATRERSGLVDLHERGVLDATGPQRQKFLQGMLSNEVASDLGFTKLDLALYYVWSRPAPWTCRSSTSAIWPRSARPTIQASG